MTTDQQLANGYLVTLKEQGASASINHRKKEVTVSHYNGSLLDSPKLRKAHSDRYEKLGYRIKFKV